MATLQSPARLRCAAQCYCSPDMLLRLHLQVEAQLSAVRSLLVNGSPGGARVASAAHRAAADLLSSLPRGPQTLGTSPEAFGAASPPQQHQQAQAMQNCAARRSLVYTSQQLGSPHGACRAPSPLGLPQVPASPGPASARQLGDQTPRRSAQQAAANLGQLAAMKAELAKAMAAMVQ